MKLSEVKAICPDFLLVQRDGKMTCGSRTGEFCTLDNYFMCELILHRMGVVPNDRRSKLIAKLRKLDVNEIAWFMSRLGIATLEELTPERVGDGFIALQVFETCIQGDLPAAAEALDKGTEKAPTLPPEPSAAPAATPPAAAPATSQQGVFAPVAQLSAAPPAARGVKGGWNDRYSLSRIECGLDCPRKFYLRYVAKAQETNPGKALRLGSLFHEGREAIDTGKPWECPIDIDPEDRAKLVAILDAYKDAHPLEITENEVEVSFELADSTGSPIPMIGYLDGIGAKCGIEFKYADPSHYSKAALNRQVSLYLKALPRLEAFTTCIAEKSKCRLKKGESLDEFQARVREGFRTDDPFAITNYHREDFAVDPTLAELVDGVHMIRSFMARAESLGGMPPAARGFMKCPNCGYRDFCEVYDGGNVEDAALPKVEAVQKAIEAVRP